MLFDIGQYLADQSAVSYKMANLAQKKNRPRSIVKEEQPQPQIKLQQVNDKNYYSQVTPPKRSHASWMDEVGTVKQQEQSNNKSYIFVPIHSYKLDYLNSMTYDDGKLYNMLTIASQKYKNGRKIKCKCSKSKCQSRYCQCFSRGSVCGVDCECSNCLNTEVRQQLLKVGQHEKGCKCSKSRCLKNYCECFQKGEKCGDKCQCVNCGNIDC